MSSQFRLRPSVLLVLACLLPLAHSPASPPRSKTPRIHQSQARTTSQLFEVVKIVDGDTIHILRDGKKEKLRLLSVDTEEKLTPGQRNSGSKPQTTYGEETRLWTIDFFEQFRNANGKIQIGLRFPQNKEARDVYGRLLCHVLTSEGTDFNLLLVQLGKSPYFNKYGNSQICHAEFVEAQKKARHHLIGIWDPQVNRPKDASSPSAKRPYDKLLPWWQARATAIDGFRIQSNRQPSRVLAADDPDGLELALAAGQAVRIFGSPDRFFDEDDGSRTVLFRASDKRRALRVSIPAEALESFRDFDLEGLREEFRQNYVYVTGLLERGPRGLRMLTSEQKQWTRAGNEPAY